MVFKFLCYFFVFYLSLIKRPCFEELLPKMHDSCRVTWVFGPTALQVGLKGIGNLFWQHVKSSEDILKCWKPA